MDIEPPVPPGRPWAASVPPHDIGAKWSHHTSSSSSPLRAATSLVSSEQLGMNRPKHDSFFARRNVLRKKILEKIFGKDRETWREIAREGAGKLAGSREGAGSNLPGLDS